MQQISFVILHYKVIDITQKCVDYLCKQKYDNFRIIIIDNHSDNGSAEELKRIYNHCDYIDVVVLERNYGFAKGNDIGYTISKHKYEADIIVIMNNDIMIEDNSFCERLNRKYLKTDYGVIGPDIINLIGEHQNPLSHCVSSYKQARNTIIKQKVKSVILKVFKPKKRKKSVTPPNTNCTYKTSAENVPLHGSCLIFTRKFTSRNEFAFYPDTFLYAEEDILFYLCKKNDISLFYDPEFRVLHMEDVASSYVNNSYWKKRSFELDNSNYSLKQLVKIMKNEY